MIRFALLSILLLLLLSACAAMQDKPRLVIMQHPETMDFQNCEVGPFALGKDFAENDACVKRYQEKGYVIWGER